MLQEGGGPLWGQDNGSKQSMFCCFQKQSSNQQSSGYLLNLFPYSFILTIVQLPNNFPYTQYLQNLYLQTECEHIFPNENRAILTGDPNLYPYPCAQLYLPLTDDPSEKVG
eukprot:TRINITY_DN29395_c1_g1_i1.p1 TRINITY_DN29395_c1_g1~~TRINITY_DN29395_c1_g1_i1.p1  ORF type:complete len:111 (+),score=5.54 TRINITY_DN29395_c1_g1_i1:129-461(+)